MKILHIISSPRGGNSRTLNLSNAFITTLKGNGDNISVKELDLFELALPEITAGSVDAKYTLMRGGILEENHRETWESISKLSNEFLDYDLYVVTCPMWNFSIPYKLKHYIDTIMQAGILFSFTERGVEGLAKDKKMVVITSRGNDYGPGTYMHQFDYQEPYLRAIFGLAGISDISFVNAQPLDFAPGVTQASLQRASDEVKVLAQAILA